MTSPSRFLAVAFALLALVAVSSARITSRRISTLSRQSVDLAPFLNFRAFNRRPRRLKRTLFLKCRSVKFSQFRTLSGFCNNLKNPKLGSADTPFVNLATPLRPELPSDEVEFNPRTISNLVSDEQAPVPNARKLTEFLTFFGQILDHDVTEVPSKDNVPKKIRIPLGDPVFVGEKFIPFFRSERVGSGDALAPLNELSHFVDGSAIYGVSEEESAELREFKAGRLKLPGNLLPRNPVTGLFLAGDRRVNENINLSAMHLVWAREHNRVAAEVARGFPKFDDQEIFELARHIVAAEFQAVVYYEFLPALTGSLLPPFKQYNPKVDPRISTDFATVGFRVGHTLLTPVVGSVNEFGKTVNETLLRDAFFEPDAFVREGIDNLFRSMISRSANEIDAGVTGEVRNFLIGDENSDDQLDLVALNIQRGRDHQVPTCNNVRRSLGLKPFTTFTQVTSNTKIVRALKIAYKNKIEAMDAWICGIAEDNVTGSSLGELFQTIIRGQFTRLRNGDRFYFENPEYFKKEQKFLPAITRLFKTVKFQGKVSLFREIILDNTGLKPTFIKQSGPFTL